MQEKTFVIIQHPFLIFKKMKKKKTSQQTGNRQKLPQLTRDIYDIPIATIINHSARLNMSLLTSGTPTTSSQHCTRGSSQCSKGRKRPWNHSDWKRSKMSSFTYNIIFYVENLWNVQKKRLRELISNLGKARGYKINTQNHFYFYILAMKKQKLKNENIL